MEAEDRGGAGGGDRALDGGADGRGFAGTRDVNAEAFRLAENGDGERECVEGHVGERREATVVHLLLAAGEVELDDFDEERVGEVGDGRVVEGDVAVFPDAHADKIDGLFAEEGGIAGGDGAGVGLFGGQRMEAAEGNVAEEMVLEVVAKALRVRGGEADVVVHVKRRDARPVERKGSGLVDEGGEEFVLRRGAGEDDAGLALTGEDAVQVRGDGAGGGTTEGRAVGVDFDGETAGGRVVRGGDGHGRGGGATGDEQLMAQVESGEADAEGGGGGGRPKGVGGVG